VTDARTDQEIVQDALQLAGHQKHRYVPPFGTDIDQETRHGRSGDGGCLMCDATAALGRLVEARDTARREADIQLGEKLAAQITLKAITDSLCLPLAELGNGWTEATAKILKRIEEIVDQADRDMDRAAAAEAERDTARRKSRRLKALWATGTGDVRGRVGELEAMLTASEAHTEHWEARALSAEAERDTARRELADALLTCSQLLDAEAERRAERDVAIQERDDAQTLNARLAEDCKTAVTNWREAEADLGPALARLERVEAARRAIAALEADELDMYRECRAEGSNAEAAQHDSRLSAYRKSLALLAAALSDVTPPPSEPGPERETAHRVTHESGSLGGAAGAVDE